VDQFGPYCAAVLNALDEPLAVIGGEGAFANRAWRDDSATCPACASLPHHSTLTALTAEWQAGGDALARLAQKLHTLAQGEGPGRFEGQCACSGPQGVATLRVQRLADAPGFLFTHRHADSAERELSHLDHLASPQPAAATAAAFGLHALRESAPDAFTHFTARYGELVDWAVEERTYRVRHPLRARLQQLADEFAFLNAGPRDVVEVHTSALHARTHAAKRAKALAYIEEARLLLIELLGLLAANYRNRGVGLSAAPRALPGV